MTTQLMNLSVDEVSGVDRAANLFEGWLVMKSREGGDGVLDEQIQELLDNTEGVVAEVEGLHKALDSEEGLFSAAPDEVKEAAGVVRTWLGDLLEPAKKQEADRKPGFAARVMATLLGTTEKQEEHGPPAADEPDAEAWAQLCKRIAEGEEEVA